MKFRAKFLTQDADEFEIINHVTCFEVAHRPSRTYNIGGRAFKTREEAQAEADKWLPWFYSVSFKEPKRAKLRWVEVPTQEVHVATRDARDYARLRGIPGELYGVSRTNRPIMKPVR